MEDEVEGRVRIAVRSASELTAAELDSIAQRFADLAGGRTGGTVLPELEVDPDLLGGIEVEVQGRVFDGSVRTRLRRLARSMGGNG
jgi:F-type H+-transporting ATPase subunit delta